METIEKSDTLRPFYLLPIYELEMFKNAEKLRRQPHLDLDTSDLEGYLADLDAPDRERGTVDVLATEFVDVADLIRALGPYAGGRRRWAVMQSIRGERKRAGLPVPRRFEDDIERAFEQHCADSNHFKRLKQPLDGALFHRPLGRDSAIWAVHSDRAEVWLKGRR